MKNDLQPSAVIEGVEVFSIPGYEGYYSISKCGRVWGHERHVHHPSGKTKKVGSRWSVPNCFGRYATVMLSKRGESKNHTVHRLMAKTFLDLGDLHVDHINGIKTDNRLENLRLATNTQNQHNRKATKRSSRFKGVCFYKRSGRWKAYICVERRQRALGYFDTEEEAAEAYDRAAAKIHGEFANLNLKS